MQDRTLARLWAVGSPQGHRKFCISQLDQLCARTDALIQEKKLTALQLSIILNAMAGMRYKNEAILSKICTELLRGVSSLDVQACCMTLNALARLRFVSGPLMQALQSTLLERQQGFNAQNVSLIFNSYTKLSVTLQEDLSTKLGNLAAASASSFKAQELATTLNALPLCGYTCTGETVNKLLLQVAVVKSNFLPFELALVLNALTK